MVIESTESRRCCCCCCCCCHCSHCLRCFRDCWMRRRITALFAQSRRQIQTMPTSRSARDHSRSSVSDCTIWIECSAWLMFQQSKIQQGYRADGEWRLQNSGSISSELCCQQLRQTIRQSKGFCKQESFLCSFKHACPFRSRASAKPTDGAQTSAQNAHQRVYLSTSRLTYYGLLCSTSLAHVQPRGHRHRLFSVSCFIGSIFRRRIRDGWSDMDMDMVGSLFSLAHQHRPSVVAMVSPTSLWLRPTHSALLTKVWLTGRSDNKLFSDCKQRVRRR
jgi:hypothetical protein